MRTTWLASRAAAPILTIAIGMAGELGPRAVRSLSKPIAGLPSTGAKSTMPQAKLVALDARTGTDLERRHRAESLDAQLREIPQLGLDMWPSSQVGAAIRAEIRTL